MPIVPRDNLLRQLQHLDDSGSAERQAARQRRQEQSSGEILTTFLAYKLDHAADKMALGLAIGDPLTLLHEPENPWDSNAVKVFWKEQWIGYLPKDMAALVAAEVPEAGAGLAAVITGLTTTSKRDAFRLQISIPIPKASRRLRALGVTSAFAWDFDRNSASDKMRLVINCTETAFRELQDHLAASFDVSKCGYSYYPTQDGRHYPWYLSLTDRAGKAPEDAAKVEQSIRSLFGVPSETTRARERLDRLDELEKQQEQISKRLEASKAEERRLRREFDFNKAAWERRTVKAQEQGEQAVELATSVEGELKEQLDLRDQELELVLLENKSLEDQLAVTVNQLDAIQLQLDYLQQNGASDGRGDPGLVAWGASAMDATEQELNERLFNSLRSVATKERLKPRQCLQLISDELFPGHLHVLESAWDSADQAKGFEHGGQLFELLWLLASAFRQRKLDGAPDMLAGQVFGAKSYAPRESQTIERNPQARRARTFSYDGKTVEMWQHLKIGAKDSESRTLRVHFCWDAELGRVVIGHCGKHLYNPSH